MASKPATSKVIQKIYSNGKVEDGEWAMTLDDMQQFVGGYIEMVQTRLPRQLLVVNEEGNMLQLPPNSTATDLVVLGTLMARPGIRGDALLVKR